MVRDLVDDKNVSLVERGVHFVYWFSSSGSNYNCLGARLGSLLWFRLNLYGTDAVLFP